VADLHLRELERAALRGDSGGDHGAAGRWLRERLRAGQLTARTLARAAYLGDPVAVGLVDPTELGPLAATAAAARPSQEEVAVWVYELQAWGQEWCVRAAVAAARLALGERADPVAQEAIAAACEWLAAPSDTSGNRALSAGKRTMVARSFSMRRRRRILEAALQAASAAAWRPPPDADDQRAGPGPGNPAACAARAAARLHSPAEVVLAVRAALVPRLLGLNGPAPWLASAASPRNKTR
jgi:hypothetical protein